MLCGMPQGSLFGIFHLLIECFCGIIIWFENAFYETGSNIYYAVVHVFINSLMCPYCFEGGPLQCKIQYVLGVLESTFKYFGILLR